MTLYEHTLKNDYIGEVVTYDFTKSDYGFVYNAQNGTGLSYGYNSNGLFAQAKQGYAVAWRIPSTITSKGLPKTISLEISSTGEGNGGGIAYGADTYRSRWIGTNTQSVWSGATRVDVSYGSNLPTSYTLTIDLQNAKQTASFSDTVLNMPSAHITQITNYWNNGTLNITANKGLDNQITDYIYIKKLILTF